MVFYSQTMMALALELALRDPLYEDMAAKFLEHFLWISSAMDLHGSSVTGLWDEEDGFFYDVLRLPDGEATRLKTRSIVGLLPSCAVLTLESDTLKRFPALLSRAREWPDMVSGQHAADSRTQGATAPPTGYFLKISLTA